MVESVREVSARILFQPEQRLQVQGQLMPHLSAREMSLVAPVRLPLLVLMVQLPKQTSLLALTPLLVAAQPAQLLLLLFLEVVQIQLHPEEPTTEEVDIHLLTSPKVRLVFLDAQ
jgi:hypothetical protein